MPAKLDRCVTKVKAQGKDESAAYAICSDSTGYKVQPGSTKKDKKWKKEKKAMTHLDRFYLLKQANYVVPGLDEVVQENESVAPDVDKVYRALSKAETGGEKNPWIRTREIPEDGSSAWGPVQMTRTLVKDYLKRMPDEFDVNQTAFGKNLISQADKFLEFGNEPNKPGYDPIYEYGGTGHLTRDNDKVLYENLAKRIIELKLQDSGGDMSSFLKDWRGSSPSESYLGRFNEIYNQ
jgi:hypothetical protein